MTDEETNLDERSRQIEEAWRQHDILNLPPRHPPKRQWAELHFQNQGGICHYCKGEMTLDSRGRRRHIGEDEWPCVTLDHLISRAEQGPDSFENTCAACYGCNLAKGSLPLDLFLTWCEYAIRKYDDIAERRRYLKLEAISERHRLANTCTIGTRSPSHTL